MHSAYLNAISRPDLNPEYLNFKSSPTDIPQGHNQQQHQIHHDTPMEQESSLTDEQRALNQFQEHQRQQQLYIQQLQLMQKLQSMPGSTTRPWYPTFGPAITTSCSDSTIQLDSPHQYTLMNNARLNKPSVGPHWKSIQPSSTYSPTSSPPSSSPRFPSLSASTRVLAATGSIETYSSPSSINQARATSFSQQHLQHPHRDVTALYNMETAQGNYTHYTHPFLNNNGTQQQTTGNMKRKASWDEQEDDEDEDGQSPSSLPTDTSLHRVDLRSESLVSPLNLIESSAHHRYLQIDKPNGGHHLHRHSDLSVPTLIMDQRQWEQSFQGGGEGDFEMTSGYTPESVVATPNSGHMSVDVSVASSVDQEDLEDDPTKEEKESKDDQLLGRRTKQKLDLVALNHLGLVSEADVQRAQSGERTLDIFQECFYNAASR
ncbi:hypothetical protein BGZ93_000409 [Podila epicladia]|nr:hypothetical protein BGZ92_009759 [Podila epicladia]KAG0098332.1 hypothetical protein BGZ93_000409 [Podila epicladia]